MLHTKFQGNWPSGSGEICQNVIRIKKQTDKQADRQIKLQTKTSMPMSPKLNSQINSTQLYFSQRVYKHDIIAIAMANGGSCNCANHDVNKFKY